MGRPLFSAQIHVTSCPCQTCSAPGAPTRSLPSSASLPHTTVVQPPRSTAGNEPSTIQLTEQDILRTLTSSRESIQRVSSAIEAAYERLIALTSSLQQRLHTMSNEHEQARNDTGMGPNHSAIVLSGPTSTSPDAALYDTTTGEGGTPARTLPNRSANTSTHIQRTSQALETIRQRFIELTERVPGDGPNPALSDGESSRPPSTVLFGPRSRDPVQARRNFLMAHLMYGRDSNSSDPTTTLGRRVEARAAAARNAEVSTDARIHDTIGESSFTVTLLNRQRERLLESSRNFRRTPVNIADRPSSADGTTEAQTPTAAELRPETSSDRPWQVRHRTALWRDNLRDRRPVNSLVARYSGSSGVPRASSRLEVHPLPPLTPRRASERGPSISDDAPELPGLDISSNPDEEQGLDFDLGQIPLPRGLYLSALSRASSSRYEDFIATPEVEDDDDPYSWMMGSTRRPQPPLVGLDSARSRADMLGRTRASRDAGSSTVLPDPRPSTTVVWDSMNDEVERTSSSYTVPIVSSLNALRAARRRPPLDPDGNEIPTDEEEEYERNRSHMRARAQALTSRAANSESTPLLRDFMSSTMPPPPPSWSSVNATTRGADDFPIIPDDGFPRVNLGTSGLRSSQSLPEGSGQSRWVRASRLRHTISPIQEYGSTTPFHANPIPWTPVDLTPSSRARVREKRLGAKSRPVRSPLAGR